MSALLSLADLLNGVDTKSIARVSAVALALTISGVMPPGTATQGRRSPHPEGGDFAVRREVCVDRRGEGGHMVIEDFLNRLECVKSQKGGWIARCPSHDDKKPSLSIAEGNDGRILLTCHAGCAIEDVAAALNLKLSDLFLESKGDGKGRVIEAIYDYRDEVGKLLFQAVRHMPKGFSQRRPDGAGGWIYNLKDVRRVPYRLPELLAAPAAETVYLVEGEKDVDRLRAGGLVATCSPMGAGKWREEYVAILIGRKVVIIPDNDQAGRDHAQTEAKSLRGGAASVKMLTLSGLSEKGDVSDWLSMGGTIETLRAMAEAAPEWTPGGDSDSQPKADAERIAISWGELCEMKLARRETILHEVERGEIVMCPAITNRGKTTLWRNIALSLACGREFAPLVKPGAPRSILYLDFETRLYRARADITKMLGALTQSERALISTNLHLIADCRIKGRPLTLSDPHQLEIVEAEARRVNADVIIIDTLTAAFEVENENDNSEAARVMKKLTALALRLNCVIVFLHHIGKARQEEGQTVHAVHRARGASAYSGFSHAIFSLLPDPVLQERNTLECAKVKGERFDDTILNLEPVSRWFVSVGVVEKAPSPYDQMIAVFNGKPLKRASVIEKLPKIPRGTLDRYLKEAVRTGDLIKLDNGEYQKSEKFSDSHAYRDEKVRKSVQVADNAEDDLDSSSRDKNEGENFSDDGFWGEAGDMEGEWVG